MPFTNTRDSANTPRSAGRGSGRDGADARPANTPRPPNQPRPAPQPEASATPEGELKLRTPRRENPNAAPPKEPRKPLLQPGWRWKPGLGFLNDRRVQLFIGFTLLAGSLYLAASFVSYLFTGHADQSVVENLDAVTVREGGAESKNGLGLLGAWVSHLFLYEWFGVASFALLPFIFFGGFRIVFKRAPVSLLWMLGLCLFVTGWTSLALGYVVAARPATAGPAPEWLSGGMGFEVASWLRALLGGGTVLLLGLGAAAFLIFFFNITTLYWAAPSLAEARLRRQEQAEEEVEAARTGRSARRMPTFAEAAAESAAARRATAAAEVDADEAESDADFDGNPFDESESDIPLTLVTKPETDSPTAAAVAEVPVPKLEPKPEKVPVKAAGPSFSIETPGNVAPVVGLPVVPLSAPGGVPMTVEGPAAGESRPAANGSGQAASGKPAAPAFTIELPPQPVPLEADVAAITQEPGQGDLSVNYDPTLDLSRYVYPPLELLNDYGAAKVQVSKEELEANKDRIVETLGYYNIGIASIKATIGPTVTLYEIIPEAGVRISKIKNLEDDIALSLAALGIRIIAPIPGKGTIGIEVPNTKKEMVPMRSVLASDKFQNSEMDLPIAFGRTITNEVFVADLARMPHLLMAGATGQGKSVGLNVILTSLLYKRHPAQLKFVLVDPKKVELSLFNKIEQHFLAKLPDAEEAIITDTSKVVDTLNSLCILMDQRYSLLKDAGCRNLKEYNKKFVERRLLPTKGHAYMPFIVVIIDELADLMMTAGKEVEQPIARLAQLARAIGIHLVVATQRPSVNVITGIIKANFPARISFKVTSKVDSRTILDASGADQLIGQGDMLFSVGSDLIRLQCAFVDTPEVDKLCDYIAEQQGYPSAFELPEYVGAASGNAAGADDDGDDGARDVMFAEAARVIVTHQQGSTSLLQRRLKLGYNRAGRLIDQLEKAGVVGPFEGSKSRDVLIPDEHSLEQLLSRLEGKAGRTDD